MKLDLKDIYEDTEIKNFFRSRTLRDSSKESYVRCLKAYCNFCDKLPTDLIKEAEDEEEDRVRMKRRKIRNYFLTFHEYLRDEGKSQNTIENHFTAIKAFYKSSEIELPTISISSKSEANLAQNEVVLTKEEINKAITLCNLKYRALILLMCSSGMGSAEVRSLQYGHFLDSVNEYLDYDVFDIEDISRMLEKKGNLIGTWRIRRIKTGKRYTTFSSPESIKAIIEYLLDSKNQNKSIESRDDYLFGDGNEPLNRDTFEKYFFRLNERCDFGKVGTQGYFKSHALRHYFGTKLHENGIADYDYRKMMGKSLPKDMAPYIKPSIEHLKSEYMKALDDLSMEKVKVKKVTTPEYDMLLKEVNELREKDKQYEIELERKDEETEKLQAQLDLTQSEMDRRFKDLEKKFNTETIQKARENFKTIQEFNKEFNPDLENKNPQEFLIEYLNSPVMESMLNFMGKNKKKSSD